MSGLPDNIDISLGTGFSMIKSRFALLVLKTYNLDKKVI